MWQTLTQQSKGSWDLCVFVLTLICITSSSVLWFSVLFFFLCSPSLSCHTWHLFLLSILHWGATPHFTVFPSLSGTHSLCDVLSTFLTHFTLAYLLFIWLSLALSPHCAPSNLSPLPSWLSSWFLRLYHFVCQVGTGDAAGCRLTSLCHFHSKSHQVCLRCCLFLGGSFQVCMSCMGSAERTSSRQEILTLRFILSYKIL